MRQPRQFLGHHGPHLVLEVGDHVDGRIALRIVRPHRAVSRDFLLPDPGERGGVLLLAEAADERPESRLQPSVSIGGEQAWFSHGVNLPCCTR